MGNERDSDKTKAELLAEIQSLRDRLTASEDTLRAIQSGEVDALVVSTPDGPRIFTLQTADQSYRLLVEEMQQGAAILSAEGLILYGNQSLADLLERPLEQLIGAHFQQFLSLQDSLLFQSRTGAAAQKENDTLELFLISSSAVEIPVYITISSLNMNETLMTCLVITDLTQQKRHEETLAAERLSRFILEQAGEAILVCDADGIIIRASQVACELWGQKLLGQPFDRLGLVPAAAPSMSPEDQDTTPVEPGAGAQAPFALATILGGDRIQGLEVELQAPQGQHLSFILSAHPLADVDNQRLGAVVLLTDISARQRFEASLKSQQEQLQEQLVEIETIYQSAPIGLNVLDRELRFVRVNQKLAEMNGLSIEAHLGRTIRELLPNLADQAEAMLRPILETGEPLLNIEISGDTPAQPGVQRTWVESFWPLKDGDRIIGISTVCEEVTERKRLEVERQRALVDLRQAKAELEQRVDERTTELRRLNDDLQQSESTLRSFFDSAPMPMGIVELHHSDILHLSDNGAAAEFFGTTSQAMRHRLSSDLGVPAATIERWITYYREAERTQAPVRFEYHQSELEGGRWLSGSVCPIAVSSSGRSQFSYIVEDITDRKQAEEILSRREEQLRLTIDFTHIGTWDWDLRQDTVIWNDNHFKLLGLDPPTTADPYQSWRSAIHPDDLARVEQALQDALHQHTDYETEYRVFHPDGTLRWLVGRGRGLYDADQQPIRMLGVIIDISDRKKAEQIQEFQAVITRNMAEGVCVVRADNGIIAYANRKFEQMFGYEPGELDGQHVSVVNYATDTVSAEAVNQVIRRAVLDNQEVTYEVYNVKKDGTPFWCSATTTIFAHAEYGTVMVAVQQDISDRKESEAKLQASLKEKELLLKEIYHRVKNNLQVIYSLLNLQSRNVSDPAALSVLRDSQSRIRAMALVHEKLYKSPDLARIDLADYIQSLAYSLLETYRASGHHITLRLEIEPYSLDIETALPCGLMLTELMSNSLKYAFPGGRSGEIAILLSVSPEHQISLRVQDNGVGLPDDFDLQHMSSLGLSLVQNLSKQIKGSVVVSPQPVGSAFHITFPV
ncbi:PAS domain S-box protein [Leptolyngbya sp. CCY15150]|uniref:PAS domain S-box protein n=1 Tax=Leptolyngbya sp. CCY15150 TaxID=2767772 RepID=UPI0019510908|nr:PAS domain S-box protein [Leptolyngbya sp. CCY15150]